jgi:hypothetical protein
LLALNVINGLAADSRKACQLKEGLATTIILHHQRQLKVTSGAG